MDHSSDFHAPPPPPPYRHGFFIPKTLIIVLVVFAIGWWAGGQGYFGQEKENDEALQTIKVTGTGVVEITEAQADEIDLNGAIETSPGSAGRDDESARLENAQAVEAVEDELIALGLDASDFSIYQSYSRPVPVKTLAPVISPTPRLNTLIMPTLIPSSDVEIQATYSYDPNAIRSSLRITLDKSNLKLADSITAKLDSLSNDGSFSNTRASINSKSYVIKESSRRKFDNKAAEDALKDAKTQIDNIAKINQLKVGKTLSIEKVEDKNKKYYVPDIYYQKTTSVTSTYEVEYEVTSKGWLGL